jgi:hypothetical protein
MGRMYTVSGAGTVTNAGGDNDLWIFEPADDKPVAIRGFTLAQHSEFADTAEEAVRISIVHMAATVTNGNGTATTPTPCDHVVTAAGFTSEFNGATIATTSGASTTKAELAWNLRNSPYEFWFPDENFAFKCRQGEALIIRLQSTLADDISFASTVWVEEF